MTAREGWGVWTFWWTRMSREGALAVLDAVSSVTAVADSLLTSDGLEVAVDIRISKGRVQACFDILMVPKEEREQVTERLRGAIETLGEKSI